MYFKPINLPEVLAVFIPMLALMIALVAVVARMIVRPLLQAKYGSGEGAVSDRIRGLEARVAMLERELGTRDNLTAGLLDAGMSTPVLRDRAESSKS